MGKTRKPKAESREALINAALGVLCDPHASEVTVDAIADRAGCAKGLIIYHFGKKSALMEATIEHLTESRCSSWEACFREANSVPAAMDATWALLTRESRKGLLLAWVRIPVYAERLVSGATARFANTVGRSYVELASRSGFDGQLLPGEVGWWLASMATGIGAGLSGKEDRELLRASYLAAWLGMLAIGEEAA